MTGIRDGEERREREAAEGKTRSEVKLSSSSSSSFMSLFHHTYLCIQTDREGEREREKFSSVDTLLLKC